MSLEKESDPLRRIPTKHTGEMRAEIGSVLRAARLKRGQSLEAVAQQTRISKRFLEALENDRFEQFPAIVYLRGFLRGYCEHLEVDFDEIWAKLEKVQAAPGGEEPAAQSSVAPTVASSAIAAPAHRLAGAAIHAHTDVHSQDGSGATGAILLAVGLAMGLALWVLKERPVSSAPPVSVAPVALQPVPRSVEPKLLIRLKSDAWLRVTVDGQMVFEGRAPRGATQEWKPAKIVALRTTEPTALELELNGVSVPLGAPAADGEYRIDIP